MSKTCLVPFAVLALAACATSDPEPIDDLTSALLAELDGPAQEDGAHAAAAIADVLLDAADRADRAEVEAAFDRIAAWLSETEQASASHQEVGDFLHRLALAADTEIAYGFWDGCCYDWEYYAYCWWASGMCDYCVNGAGNCR